MENGIKSVRDIKSNLLRQTCISQTDCDSNHPVSISLIFLFFFLNRFENQECTYFSLYGIAIPLQQILSDLVEQNLLVGWKSVEETLIILQMKILNFSFQTERATTVAIRKTDQWE